ncbi:hypothetical protein TNCV_1212251 [Trichonephila clavipes]|nr:hypothetical protein TNCV_1212251 [Trichonephila clavipes]
MSVWLAKRAFILHLESKCGVTVKFPCWGEESCRLVESIVLNNSMVLVIFGCMGECSLSDWILAGDENDSHWLLKSIRKKFKSKGSEASPEVTTFSGSRSFVTWAYMSIVD